MAPIKMGNSVVKCAPRFAKKRQNVEEEPGIIVDSVEETHSSHATIYICNDDAEEMKITSLVEVSKVSSGISDSQMEKAKRMKYTDEQVAYERIEGRSSLTKDMSNNRLRKPKSSTLEGEGSTEDVWKTKGSTEDVWKTKPQLLREEKANSIQDASSTKLEDMEVDTKVRGEIRKLSSGQMEYNTISGTSGVKEGSPKVSKFSETGRGFSSNPDVASKIPRLQRTSPNLQKLTQSPIMSKRKIPPALQKYSYNGTENEYRYDDNVNDRNANAQTLHQRKQQRAVKKSDSSPIRDTLTMYQSLPDFQGAKYDEKNVSSTSKVSNSSETGRAFSSNPHVASTPGLQRMSPRLEKHTKSPIMSKHKVLPAFPKYSTDETENALSYRCDDDNTSDRNANADSNPFHNTHDFHPDFQELNPVLSGDSPSEQVIEHRDRRHPSTDENGVSLKPYDLLKQHERDLLATLQNMDLNQSIVDEEDNIKRSRKKKNNLEDFECDLSTTSKLTSSWEDLTEEMSENLLHQYDYDRCTNKVDQMINLEGESESNVEDVIPTSVNTRKEDLLKQYQYDLSVDRLEQSAGLSSSIEDVTGVDTRKEDLFKQYQYDSRVDKLKQPAELSSSMEDLTGVGTRKEDLFKQYQYDSRVSNLKQSAELSSSIEDLRGSNIVRARRNSLLEQYEHDKVGYRKENVDLVVISGEEVCEGNEKTANTIGIRKENLLTQYSRDMDCMTMELEHLTSESERLTSESPLGSQMNRYIARTKGEAIHHSSDEDEEDAVVDDSLYVDQHGVKIERSGGKVEIVKSSDSISSIKNKFGGTAQWKKANTDASSVNEVDSTTVNSARNMFREGESKKQESTSINRPVKKVMDPKQIMEMRKQVTYGNEEEEPPQDDVTQKSVGVEEIDTSNKQSALDVYKNLEKKQDTDLKLQKPKTKLVSDLEARATMDGIRSISSSASEASDVNETTIDLTVDTVSGYGSAAPCSPSSTLSEDYLSDHKESSPRDELKDSSINHCVEESELNMKVNTELENHADISPVHCQTEIDVM